MNALVLVQIAHHAPQLLAREGIERAERLVEHQQVGLVDQRAAEVGALLHAARELPGELGAEALEPDQRPAAPPPAPRMRRDRARAGCGAARRSRAAAGRCRASCATAAATGSGTPCRRSRPGPSTGLPATVTCAASGRHQPGRQLHQRGLAAARRADHGGELALVDGHGQAVDGERAAGAAE